MPWAAPSLRSNCSSAGSSLKPMIQRLLQLVLVAIVLMVALALLVVLFKVGMVLLGIALKVLLVLLVVAAILRFFELLRNRRRY